MAVVDESIGRNAKYAAMTEFKLASSTKTHIPKKPLPY